MDKFPKFDPEVQTLDNYLELITVAFIAAKVTEEGRKVSIILTHIPTNFFDDVLSLIAPKSPSQLKLDELKNVLRQHFKPQKTIVKSLAEFQDRTKKKDESYNIFYKDLNRLAELCDFSNKEEFIKYKLFLSARHEPFFSMKMADFDYHNNTVGDLLVQLSNLEAAFIDSSSSNVAVDKISQKSKNDKCKSCGKSNHKQVDCKFKEATCYKCGIQGHIATVCKSKQQSTVEKGQTYKPTKAKSNEKSKKKLQTNELQTEDCLQSDESSDEHGVLNTVKVNNINKISEPYFVNVKINGKSFPFELDTGSPISTLRKEFFDLINSKLCSTKLSLTAYNKTSIKVIGETFVNAQYNDYNVNDFRLVVVGNDVPNNLLGRDLLEKFKLISINKINETSKVDKVLSNYKVDSSKPIKNFEAHLYPKDNCAPVFQRARTVGLHLKTKIEEALSDLESKNIIQKVEYAEFASPIVPVMKSDGSVRICTDFRKVNLILHESKFPIPNMNELISSASGHKFYSKLDLKNAYLQLLVAPEDTKYLVINTHLGLYKYSRLPFGLHSAPSIFQRFIEQLLSNIEGVFPYIDDILICADTLEEHDIRLKNVLLTLQKANVQLNVKKSEINRSQVNYLGFILSEKGYQPDKDKVKSIVDAPTPLNQSELKSFLGLVSFYHSFIKNFSMIAAPLYDLTKKNNVFSWNDSAQVAFDKLKLEVAKQINLSRLILMLN